MAELKLYAQNNPHTPDATTIARRFGGRPGLIDALRERSQRDAVYADIAAMLPASSNAPEPAALKTSNKTDGFVYLIKYGDYYKVGRSDDIERRVKEVRLSLPDKAVLAHTIRTDDPPGIEAYWHKRFENRRANGEFFKLTPLDISAFKKRKFQ